MRKSWISVTVLMGSVTMAQTTEDVLYKKDGSVLRGSLIEQDFANGQYKIQLQGGSIFSVKLTDIHKISKEPSLSNRTQATNDAGINVNIENNPNINQKPVINQSAKLNHSNAALDLSIKTDAKPKNHQYRQSLRAARVKKDISDNHDNGLSFDGFSLAYQYNINKYAAVYWEHSRGTLKRVIINDREVDAEEHGYSGSLEKYSGTQITTQISTNNYQGLKVYAGIGLFSEKYTGLKELNSISGRVSTLGVGYNNNRVLIHLRVSKFKSDHYPNNFSSLSTSFQVGLEF